MWNINRYVIISLLTSRETGCSQKVHTLDSFQSGLSLGHQVTLFQVAISRYEPILNESINSKYPNLIGESNPKYLSGR